jgi:O-antigen/teichoic acid export membrane protein
MLKPRDKNRPLKNDPWEVLVVSALFFFSGIFMLFHHGPLIAVQQVYKYNYLLPSGVTAISEHGAHVFGSLGVAVAAVLVWFYFFLCRSIARDADIIDKPRWR